MMRTATIVIVLATAVTAIVSVHAQEPVVGAPNPESLFSDTNPRLHANKQIALHIMKDLLQCNRWNEADKWLTARYIQHNPLVASGRDAVVRFFGSRPRPATCDRLLAPVVAVLADGDLVTVVIAREYKDPKDPAKTSRRRGSTCGGSSTGKRTSTGILRPSRTRLRCGSA
jgi:predicted SnoaL-like aldol condensation-catalyzing enzyme